MPVAEMMAGIQRALGWAIIIWASVGILAIVAGWIGEWRERRRVRRILKDFPRG